MARTSTIRFDERTGSYTDLAGAEAKDQAPVEPVHTNHACPLDARFTFFSAVTLRAAQESKAR